MRAIVSAAVDEQSRITTWQLPLETAVRRGRMQSRAHRPSWRRALGSGIGLAAAITAALLVGRNSSGKRADVYLPPPHVPASPLVNAASGSGVAVIETADPEITVIWSF
ncbi:MAG: hypothetical protein ACYC28_13995 [Longimicrobiales bacterium]